MNTNLMQASFRRRDLRPPLIGVSFARRLLVSLASALWLLAGSPSLAQQQPNVLPTRDVDITYKVTRPHQPPAIERARWLASEQIERVDGADKSSTIFDHRAHEITLLNPGNRTFLMLEGSARQPQQPRPDGALARGNDTVVAGLKCVDWSWKEDFEEHTACLTADGVLLRLVVDGKAVMEAQSVKYVRQLAELFEVPSGYLPALAPDGVD